MKALELLVFNNNVFKYWHRHSFPISTTTPSWTGVLDKSLHADAHDAVQQGMSTSAHPGERSDKI